jgi:hypothetical protein
VQNYEKAAAPIFFPPYNNKINQFSAQHTWPFSTKGMDNPELEALSN